MSITDEIRDRLAARFAAEYDSAVAQAMLKRSVSPGVTLGELQRRLLRQVSAFSGTETYYLDGAPLVRFHPIQTSDIDGQLTATRLIEHFKIIEGAPSP